MNLKDKIEHRKYLNQIRKNLQDKYCNKENPYKYDNLDLINYVVNNIVSEQILKQNPAELEALQILSNRGLNVKYQEPIPVLSEGGKLEHLYVADILVGNIIIEIDGSSHDAERMSRDLYRDEQTQKSGYITKRFLTTEVYRLKDEKFD